VFMENHFIKIPNDLFVFFDIQFDFLRSRIRQLLCR
jgi:hypothetical protein